ncbi:hypothetical protein AVEN_231997-1 [Araneus ventricosus]|uniref:Uncharacterized protein n=1 Tax=Araneus ventricosus TaxID=182803 RepID=A0A4Y2C0C5_ARAVE|nr:hypothetical protein AVEN_231997-1 [Araneus ventricosus]
MISFPTFNSSHPLNNISPPWSFSALKRQFVIVSILWCPWRHYETPSRQESFIECCRKRDEVYLIEKTLTTIEDVNSLEILQSYGKTNNSLPLDGLITLMDGLEMVIFIGIC